MHSPESPLHLERVPFPVEQNHMLPLPSASGHLDHLVHCLIPPFSHRMEHSIEDEQTDHGQCQFQMHPPGDTRKVGQVEPNQLFKPIQIMMDQEQKALVNNAQQAGDDVDPRLVGVPVLTDRLEVANQVVIAFEWKHCPMHGDQKEAEVVEKDLWVHVCACSALRI